MSFAEIEDIRIESYSLSDFHQKSIRKWINNLHLAKLFYIRCQPNSGVAWLPDLSQLKHKKLSFKNKFDIFFYLVSTRVGYNSDE